MISKAIYALSAVQAIKIYGVEETCTSNIERMGAHASDFETYLGKGSPYTDKDFPPSTSSLFWDSFPNQKGEVSIKTDVVGWKRPSEIEGKTPSLWGSKGVQAAGVNQGSLGDCWFLAAAAAIAETPERIQRIFKNKEYPAEGIFELQFYVKGKLVNEVIDDKIPINSQGSPYSTKPSKNGAWWMPILEKAYAKLNMNYAQITGGNGDEAFRTLTGMPVMRYDTKDYTADQIWTIASDGDHKNFIMYGGCCNMEFGNLVTEHAYTVYGVIDLQQNGQSVQRLLKMRNPWGVEQYSGPWNDLDTKWTDDFKR